MGDGVGNSSTSSNLVTSRGLNVGVRKLKIPRVIVRLDSHGFVSYPVTLECWRILRTRNANVTARMEQTQVGSWLWDEALFNSKEQLKLFEGVICE